MATELPKSKRGLLLPRTCGVTFAYGEKFQKSRFNSISISIFKNDFSIRRKDPDLPFTLEYQPPLVAPLQTLTMWVQCLVVFFVFCLIFNSIFSCFSNFLLGAKCIHPNEKSPPQPPPLGAPPQWPRTGCVKMGSCLLPLVAFLDLCIFALIRKLRGENPKKGKWLGKIKNKWRQLSSHSPSTQITSTHLHTPPPPTLTLPLGPHDGVVVRDDPNVPFSYFKKAITCRQVSEKIISKRWTSLFHGFARLFGKWNFVKNPTIS